MPSNSAYSKTPKLNLGTLKNHFRKKVSFSEFNLDIEISEIPTKMVQKFDFNELSVPENPAEEEVDEKNSDNFKWLRRI